MRRAIRWLAVGGLAVVLAGCPDSGAYRPNQTLDARRFNITCEGEFEQEPALSAGRTPVFPVGMLNPTLIEDRKTRHLPMTWPVTTTFTVGADGRTSEIKASPTTPASFGNHMVVAVQSWRCVPASRGGVAMPSRCSSDFVYRLD